MVEFSLSLPPANRATGDTIPASDHNNLTEAVDDLRQQAETAVTGLETGKAAAGHDHAGVYQPVGDYSVVGHGHAIEKVSGLQAALDDKVDTVDMPAGVPVYVKEAGGTYPNPTRVAGFERTYFGLTVPTTAMGAQDGDTWCYVETGA